LEVGMWLEFCQQRHRRLLHMFGKIIKRHIAICYVELFCCL
jgi:hypothetical protein